MSRRRSAALSALVAGVALLAALPSPVGAYVAPASVSHNVQVDVRSPADPTVDFRSPVVAINPTNPHDVVIASRHDQPDYFCHVHYSLDGGKTWAASAGTGATFPDPPLPAGSPPSRTSGTCWSPGAAFDSHGNAYVVAQDRPNGGGAPQTVIVWKSTDGGRTFGTPVTIPASTSSRFSVQADIAIDRTPTSPHFGRIYVSWHEFPMQQNIYAQLVYSDDGGTMWSAATNHKLPGATGMSEVLPELAVAPDGTLYALVKGESPFTGSGTMCTGIGFGTIPAGGVDCPILLLRSSNGGISFDGDPVTVAVAHYNDTAVGEEPSIVVTPKGTVLVSFATAPNPPAAGCAAGLQAVVYRSTDRGQTWSGPRPLNDDACQSGNSHRDPRLSVAPNGRVDAAFYDNRRDSSHQRFDVYYTNSSDDGLSFGANSRLSESNFDSTLLFTPLSLGFQTRDYDTVTGLASTNDGAIAAWGDTLHDPANSSDVFSSRIGFAPVVTGYAVTNRAFVVGARRTPILASAAKAPRLKTGTAFRYTLSDAATVKIVIAQQLPGRRKGKVCLAPTRKLRHAPPCRRSLVRGTLTRTSPAGADNVAFSGRIGTRALKPGLYSATLTATDSAGDSSTPITIFFTIVAA
jgi:hypothetical protein